MYGLQYELVATTLSRKLVYNLEQTPFRRDEGLTLEMSVSSSFCGGKLT